MNLLNAFNWIHGVFFVALALVYTCSWIRGGFWVPRYVHLIALAALVAGAIFTATLPPPANPNPLVNAVFPLIFPVFFVTSTYAVAIFCGFVSFAGQRRICMHVRIVDIPAGEAPAAVRKAWVGLILPSTGRKVPRVVSLFGDRNPKYLVPVDSAISILEQKSPEAAEWWRENTPHLHSKDRYFAFAVEDCEEVA